MSILVDLANNAHRRPTTFARRSLLVVAMTGILLRDLLWWLVLIPVFIIAYAPYTALVAFFKAIIELPRLTLNQFRSDAEGWTDTWAGAGRIWRARKGPGPVIIQGANDE